MVCGLQVTSKITKISIFLERISIVNIIMLFLVKISMKNCARLVNTAKIFRSVLAEIYLRSHLSNARNV